ncbi:Leucine-rich repeat, typical subtype [Artemisia annua]|uniref:Leucine-rich repeat, typical subtype n=1 Tax=Artemisia annua TaxID=35608 RepID=A0A2U1NN06_ARTAN|nr:Leucine-rich repeat, typical subtype [Artemisia annua]
MDIIYDGNSIPNWFTNKSMGNQVKVELPLDWSFSKFRGYRICVVFKRKKPSRYFGNFGFRYFGYSLKNFDGAYLGACDPYYYREYFRDKPIRIDELDMILLHYTTSEIEWKKAKNFITFCFNESEGFELKEMGVRFVCDEDLDQEADISFAECQEFQLLVLPTHKKLNSITRLYYEAYGNEFHKKYRGSSIKYMDIIYDGNSIPNWFTNKSIGNQVKVELPLDWSFSKFRGYGICVVFKRKKPSRYFVNFGFRYFGYSLKNFDGAYLGACDPYYYREYFRDKPIRIDESDMILLHYTTSEIEWKEAKNFVTFCFNESEGFEVKEMGVRVVCDEDLDQEADVSMFQDLSTLSLHGGAWCWSGEQRRTYGCST